MFLSLSLFSLLTPDMQLHQILPPILSVLLHSSLPQSHTTQLRTTASQTLSKLLTQHSTTYPSLSPRIMKTLLLALISPGKSQGTREGAIRGLVGVGKEAVRKGLVEGGGAKVVGAEARDRNLVQSVIVRLRPQSACFPGSTCDLRMHYAFCIPPPTWPTRSICRGIRMRRPIHN